MRGGLSTSDVPLAADGLTIGYAVKGGATREVASNLGVSLLPGEFVCLLGPNGVGKSTLIRTLAGMQKPLAGEIRLLGTPVSQLSLKEKARSVSVVLTDSLPSGMFDGYSVVALGRHPHTRWTGGLGDRDKERIEWALEAVGAKGLANRQVSELSDGERQKLMIARALAQEAGVMLLDEPTAFLDLPRRVELMRTLRDLARREGLSILLSTHDLDLAMRSADTLWLLGGNGRLVTGMPEELALDGEIGRVFASGEVDWDVEHGSFRMHRAGCVQVSVEGTGAAAMWTRRTLMRIGFEVLESGASCQGRIKVEESGEGASWNVEGMGSAKDVSSLSELARFLLDKSEKEEGRNL